MGDSGDDYDRKLHAAMHKAIAEVMQWALDIDIERMRDPASGMDVVLLKDWRLVVPPTWRLAATEALGSRYIPYSPDLRRPGLSQLVVDRHVAHPYMERKDIPYPDNMTSRLTLRNPKEIARVLEAESNFQ
jgi:hypothetical protein